MHGENALSASESAREEERGWDITTGILPGVGRRATWMGLELSSASGGKEMPASLSISSNASPKGSRWITSVVSGIRVQGTNDSRTLRSASPKTFECAAQDSESRWSSEQS